MIIKHGNFQVPVNADHCIFEIRGAETDFRDRLHLASLFVMMQEAAYQNAEGIGMGASNLDSQGVCWLLSKISVRMKSLPEWHEKLTVSTWSRGAKRLLFLRDFIFSTMHEGESTPIGSATSEWFLAEQESHRPVRPEQIINPEDLAEYKNAPAVFDFRCPRMKNLELSASSEALLIKYADFSDIDRNGHVNNTRYVAWAADALQVWLAKSKNRTDLVDMTIYGIDIQYICEVFFGNEIKLYALPIQLKSKGKKCLMIEGKFGENQQTAFRSKVYFSDV